MTVGRPPAERLHPGLRVEDAAHTGAIIARALANRRGSMRLARLVQRVVDQESAAHYLYKTLVATVLGDYAKAERLIAYERRSSPRADRATLIQDALNRLERDQR